MSVLVKKKKKAYTVATKCNMLQKSDKNSNTNQKELNESLGITSLKEKVKKSKNSKI